MTPRRPSLPTIISRTLGPFEALGIAGMTSTPPGRTTRTPRTMCEMSPYLSDCMPDERVATQPPSVEWVKLSGKWPRVQPRSFELRLEVRAERAGLDAGESRVGVDVDDAVEASEVERDDGAGLADVRLEAARDVAAAAERDDARHPRPIAAATTACTSPSSAG